MTQRRFFRRVWQFNALAIAAVMSCGLLLGAFGVYEMTKHLFRDRTVQTLARIPAAGDQRNGDALNPGEVVTIGTFSKLRGHDIFWAPVHAKQNYRGPSLVYSKNARSMRNYAFYNAVTGESRRLLDSDRTVISTARPMAAGSVVDKPAIAAILYEVIRTDSNKDGAFSVRDLRDLVFSKPDGSGVVTAVKDVDRLHGQGFSDPDTIVLIFSRKGVVTAEHFSATDFGSIKSVPILQ